jgi:hypothetical protein
LLFFKSDIQTKKKPPAGMLATEVRSGDAPKHTFSMKTDEKSKKSGKNTQTVFFEQK